jgi:hypothetical protein
MRERSEKRGPTCTKRSTSWRNRDWHHHLSYKANCCRCGHFQGERERGRGRFLPCTYTAIDNHGPVMLIHVISNDSPLPPALSGGRLRVNERTPQTLNVLLRPPPCTVMVHPLLFPLKFLMSHQRVKGPPQPRSPLLKL